MEQSRTSSHDGPGPIVRRREVTVFSNTYGDLYYDEVLSPSGAPGRHLRWKSANDGVVVIPRWGRRVALIPVYRYAVDRVSLEFPRGMCLTGEPPATAAARELLEETGLRASALHLLGSIHSDTGLVDDRVDVLVADTDPRTAVATRREALESIASTEWHRVEDLADILSAGAVSCGLTLAALTLLNVDTRPRSTRAAGRAA